MFPGHASDDLVPGGRGADDDACGGGRGGGACGACGGGGVRGCGTVLDNREPGHRTLELMHKYAKRDVEPKSIESVCIS